MKYLGWIISIVLIIAFCVIYRTQYVPVKNDILELEKEIAMWENVLKDEKGLTGDRFRFATDRFFKNNRLTPYGEVEILRKFDPHNKGLEIYLSAPRAFVRAKDVLTFLSDQRITFKRFTCIVEIDSIERFEYKFVK